MMNCKYCDEELPQNAHVGGFYLCTKCETNFGAMYCLNCLVYYFHIQRRLCVKCEKGIQG